MASKSNLDRLYTQLTALTGIKRTRDVRLEKIAADRAVEMRYQQGLTLDPGEQIVHEIDQLKARIHPWQLVDHFVTENATWHYYPGSWVDPVSAAIDATLPDGTKVGWWNSAVHRQQLMNPAYTHWGHGIHFEDVDEGARRWYFITVFAADMEALEQKEVNLYLGKQIGFHLTAAGQMIHKVARTFQTDQLVTVDDRQNFPGRGPMIHLVGKPLNTYWIADDEEFVQWQP